MGNQKGLTNSSAVNKKQLQIGISKLQSIFDGYSVISQLNGLYAGQSLPPEKIKGKNAKNIIPKLVKQGIIKKVYRENKYQLNVGQIRIIEASLQLLKMKF